MTAFRSILALAAALSAAGCSTPEGEDHSDWGPNGSSSSSSSGSGAPSTDKARSGVVIEVDAPEHTTLALDESPKFEVPRYRATKNGTDITSQVQVTYTNDNLRNGSLTSFTTSFTGEAVRTLVPTLSVDPRYGWGVEQKLTFQLPAYLDATVVRTVQLVADRDPPTMTGTVVSQQRCESQYTHLQFDCEMTTTFSVYPNGYVTMDTKGGLFPLKLLGKLRSDVPPDAQGGNREGQAVIVQPSGTGCTPAESLHCIMYFESYSAAGAPTVIWDKTTKQIVDGRIVYQVRSTDDNRPGLFVR